MNDLTTTKEALEPCPFCGAEGVPYPVNGGWFAIHHTEVCYFTQNGRDITAHHIPMHQNWNSRVSAPIVAPVVDENDQILLEALRRVRADQDDFWTFYQADPLMVKAADRIEELLRWHSTEQAMHTAWRKRAEEAEATLAAPAATVAPQQSDDLAQWSSVDNWPLPDVLNKLADATECLLNDYNYDRDGWEQLKYAALAARRHIALLAAPAAPARSVQHLVNQWQAAWVSTQDISRDPETDLVRRIEAYVSPVALGDEAGRQRAIKLLRELRETTDPAESTLAKGATDEIVKGWFWHLPERDQNRARLNIEQIIERCLAGGGEK